MYLQRSIRTASLVLSMMTLVIGLSIVFGASAGPVSATSNEDEQVFVQLINQIRTGKGLPPLVVDGELTNAARSWSSNMAGRDSLAHSPDMAGGISAQWTVLGENVGVHGIHDPQALFRAFVDSPSHYRNLIDPRFQYVGVGVVHAPNGKLWTTHKFMAASAPAPVAPADTTPPTTAPAPPTTAETTPPVTNPPATKPRPTTPAVPQPPTTEPPVAPTTTTQEPNPAATTSLTAATGGTDDSGLTDHEVDGDPEQPTESEPGDEPVAAFPIDSFGPNAGSPGDDMADLVRPDAETIETVLIDLMMAGV